METTISNAFLLLIIGMITVSIILLLVVVSGNLVINIVNRISKKEIPSAKTVPSIAPEKIAAIVAAVDQITGSKGKIESIEKH